MSLTPERLSVLREYADQKGLDRQPPNASIILELLDHIDTLTAEQEWEVCPFDCDSCHGDGCPCDRLGCEGDPT